MLSLRNSLSMDLAAAKAMAAWPEGNDLLSEWSGRSSFIIAFKAVLPAKATPIEATVLTAKRGQL